MSRSNGTNNNRCKKLEINEKQFIGKPLRNLFNEIRPQIKRALVSAGGGETNSFFDFYFVTYQEASTLRNSGKRPVTIRVYTNEIINWDASNKPRGDRWKWDENDIKKYGNLTIKAIRVDGEY